MIHAAVACRKAPWFSAAIRGHNGQGKSGGSETSGYVAPSRFIHWLPFESERRDRLHDPTVERFARR
jgi:hypothetical protein